MIERKVQTIRSPVDICKNCGHKMLKSKGVWKHYPGIWCAGGAEPAKGVARVMSER